MSTVSLQTVFDEARQAIETGAADKAIGIAQHILAHYPRMIEGSRLLGEAQLNAGQPEQAADSFERVLHADPENVAAYYGLGLARQSIEQRSAAVTAFERALEIQPNLADLRTQLMRLYAETPGSAGQFRLSRAGLGRLYARGGMFGQAIDEFRAVLDADPSRDDVKVALAESLWRDGQEDEAADYCRDLLDRQPDLLKPTVLLGYMQLAAGQPEGESLWRRAAEQDAQMVLPRTLFDILPPIRIEDPVLLAFNEAEWRSQEARRAAVVEEPVVAAPVAVDDDDFFADSWLGGTGSSSLQPATARMYAEPVAGPAGIEDGGDDDLLASLLGFGDFSSSSAPASTDVEADVQPFALGDWADDSDEPSTVSTTPPASLNNMGLEDDSTTDQNGLAGDLKPFSSDDWDLDQPATMPSAQAAVPAQDDMPNVSAFSLDDIDDDDQAVQPFSFDDRADDVGDVKPFALDDDFGTEPFSFEDTSPTPIGNNDGIDAGLGDIKPFSFDEWGLDDDQPLSTSSQSSNNYASNDLDDLKPFSLDELSLDSLDANSGGTLSGPDMLDEDVSVDEPTDFKWQEPSWRSQATASTSARTDDDSESIFAKLIRSRSTDAPVSEPAAEVQQPLDEEDLTFFSEDNETLRIDDDATADSFAALQDQNSDDAGAGDQLLSDMDTVRFSLDDMELDGEATPFAFDTMGEDASTAPSPFTLDDTGEDAGTLSSPFTLDDLGLDGDTFTGFGDVSIGTDAATGHGDATSEQDESTLPFTLDDLGLDDDALANLGQQPELVADMDGAGTAFAEQPSNNVEGTVDETIDELSPFALDIQDLDGQVVRDVEANDSSFSWSDLADSEPTDNQIGQQAETFSLSDLGLDDDFSLPGGEQATTGTADESEMRPFSLSELGLTDDEIAALNVDDDMDVSLFDNLPNNEEPSVANTEVSGALPSEAEMVPFSLSELGLTDDEIALLNQESTTANETESLDDMFGDNVNLLEQDVPTGEVDDRSTLPPLEHALEEVDEPASIAVDDVPEMVPFSLSELGLTDDELALFDSDATDVGATDDEGEGAFVTPAPSDAMQDADGFTPEAAEPVFEEGELAVDDAGIDDARDHSLFTNDFDINVVSDEQAAEQELAEPFISQETSASMPTEPLVLREAEQFSAGYGDMSMGFGGLSAIIAQLDRESDNDTLRLAVARMSQQTEQSAQAIEQYKHLIKRGELLDDVVDDLQDAIADTSDPQMLRRFHRLLGDAYMKQNRFREAMDEYSWTLART